MKPSRVVMIGLFVAPFLLLLVGLIWGIVDAPASRQKSLEASAKRDLYFVGHACRQYFGAVGEYPKNREDLVHLRHWFDDDGRPDLMAAILDGRYVVVYGVDPKRSQAREIILAHEGEALTKGGVVVILGLETKVMTASELKEALQAQGNWQQE